MIRVQPLSRSPLPELHPVPGALENASVAARMPYLPSKTAPRPEPALTLCQAFAMLVSAACYLAAQPGRATPEGLEAFQMLYDLSLEVLDGGIDTDDTCGQSEDLIWQQKQEKWERLHRLEGALRHVRAAADERALSSAKGGVGRWLRRGRGAPKT